MNRPAGSITSEGAYLISSTGTAHVITWWSHESGEARAACGFEGEPTEGAEPDRSDVCGNCAEELGVEIEESSES